MISIGAVHGGPEYYTIQDSINSLMGRCKDDRDGSALVNIVYHLPGSVIKHVPFKGQRTAKFSKKDKILMIQVAIEPSWVSSTDDELIRQHIYKTADAALKLAKEAFTRYDIEYDLETDREFLREWLQASSVETPSQ